MNRIGLTAVILIGVTSGAASLAGTEIRSQFKLNLDASTFYSTVNKLMSDFKGDVVVPVPNITINNPIHTVVSGINVTVHVAMPKPTQSVTSPRDWNVATNQLSADMNIANVNATGDVIIPNPDGSTFVGHVNATCANIHLVLPAGVTTASGTVHAAIAQNQLQLTLSNFNAAWVPGSWQIASLVCRGPGNFGDQVAAELMRQLSTINPFLGQIQGGLQQQLSQIAQNATSSIFSNTPTGNGDLQTYTEASSLADAADGGVLVDGIVHFIFPRVTMPTPMTGVIQFAAPPTTLPTTSSVLVPYQTASLLMAAGYWNASYLTSFNSDQLSGFSDLQHNKIAEWVVWPDLTNFDKNTLFLMQTWATSVPEFKNPVKTGDGVISASVKLTSLMRMMGPHRDRPALPPAPYVTFFPSVSGTGTIQINNGLITFTLPKPTVNLDYAFDVDYLSEFNPNTKIDTKRIIPMLQSYLAQSAIKYQLPPMNVTPAIQIVPTSINLEDQNLRIYFVEPAK